MSNPTTLMATACRLQVNVQEAWSIMRNLAGKSSTRIPLQSFSAKELLHRALSGLQFRDDLTHDGKHRDASIVDLLASHLVSELLPLEGVTEASWVLHWLPSDGLMTGNQEHDQGETFKALGGAQGCQSSWHVLKAWELYKVGKQGSSCCHHCEAAVLNLCSSQVLEASWITREGHQTTLGKAQWIKETQRHGDTWLLCNHKRWLRCIKAKTALIVLGQDTCSCHLLSATSCCTKCNDAGSSRCGRNATHGRPLALSGSIGAHWNMALIHSVWG
mmetsp:Transcript_10560/g.11641  ORF Transcript_10560/g.11641 Transcript_10560/m.11641 type:complete len:274 (-) Transcript_10560:32-853(-)